MADILDDSAMGAKQRPTFLTVLCILTFVGSGWGVIQALMNFGNPAAEFLPILNIANIIGLVCSIGCIFAAFMMWKLKKMGFFVYVGCTLLSVAFTLYVTFGTGLLDIPGFGQMVMMIAIVQVAISIGFVIMYYVNLKHME